MGKKQCGDCLFWRRHDKEQDDLDEGDCMRYPPRLVDALVVIQSEDKGEDGFEKWDDAMDSTYSYWNTRFPVTESRGWCGEFKAKPKQKDE